MKRSEVRSKLFQSFFDSIFNGKILIAFILFFFLIFSAFMVVVIKYHHKVALDEEQKIMSQERNLRDEWTQILIEHSTLASPSHIEEIAKKSDMLLPKVKEIKVIQIDA